MVSIAPVHSFQTSLETIRAHHWRFFADTYTGCAFNCQYCLYKGPGDYGAHVSVSRGESEADPTLGILEIGTTTDPYQPIEAKQQLTRNILSAALKEGIPLFVLTRSEMIERDIDLLKELAERGLVEVGMSVTTFNRQVSAALEPVAPSTERRLEVAQKIAGAGIPVSFHVAPLIPGVDSESEITDFGRLLAERSTAGHIFTAMLGAQKPYWLSFQTVMSGVKDSMNSYAQFIETYPLKIDFDRSAAVTCSFEQAESSLMALREGVRSGGGTLVSENHPFFTTGALEGGIYRFKLPTIWDMAEFVRSRSEPTTWATFEAWYQAYKPGAVQWSVVRDAWASGELFVGCEVDFAESSEVAYTAASTPLGTATRTLVARKGH